MMASHLGLRGVELGGEEGFSDLVCSVCRGRFVEFAATICRRAIPLPPHYLHYKLNDFWQNLAQIQFERARGGQPNDETQKVVEKR